MDNDTTNQVSAIAAEPNVTHYEGDHSGHVHQCGCVICLARCEGRTEERQRTPARAYARIELITPAAGRDVPADSWDAYQLGVREAAGPFIDEIARIAYNHGLHDGAADERQRIRQLAIDCKAIYVTWAPLVPPAVADFADLLDRDAPEQPRGVRYYVLMSDELADAYDPAAWPACLRLIERRDRRRGMSWWLVDDTEAPADLEGKRVELTFWRLDEQRPVITERKVIE